MIAETPDEAVELARKVVKGLCALARAVSPTCEGEDGKRVHHSVGFVGSTAVVGSDRAEYAAVVELRPEEFLNKKSKLRGRAAEAGVDASVNYGRASAWLKLHEKNVRGGAVSGAAARRP